MQEFQLAWGQKVSPEFRSKLLAICAGFGWQISQASDLMACIAWESGETFSPTIRNGAGSGAIGLIQFMPDTAAYLETTIHDLAAMTAEDQLSVVRKYFRPYASRIVSLNDMYMAILLPKYIGKDDNSILFSGGISYRQNSGLDANHDGMITKAEATAKVREKLVKGLTLTTTETWPYG